jgi:hypothetical protein
MPRAPAVSVGFIAAVAGIAAVLGAIAFVSVKPAPAQANGGQAGAPETVDVVLRAEPREAHFSIDEGPALENPWVGRVPRDGKAHLIRVRAPGHQEKTREVTFDRDITLGLLLIKEPKR